MADDDLELMTGTFEPAGNSAGYLRAAEANYAARPSDAVVGAELRRALRLRGGETVTGTARNKSGKPRNGRPELQEVTAIDGLSVGDHLELTPFEQLIPIDPREQVHFETSGGPTTMRVVDLLTPIGFGQRGLIVAPPRTGKTILLQQMAQAVATNYPDVYSIVLLIDERPEEVTEMRRSVRGEVIASSNDQDVASHLRIARLVNEKAKRLVEAGRNVFMVLDSLTRLGRAFNVGIRGAGRIMSGGLDIKALLEPKAIFGAARNVENGGSLTIVASALIDTGSRMDQVIFNEFKGTGNMEIMLSREMADRRLWPAIDLTQSGTRKEELLLAPEALAVSHSLRRTLLRSEPVRAMELLLEALERHDSNVDFVARCSQQPMRSPRFGPAR